MKFQGNSHDRRTRQISALRSAIAVAMDVKEVYCMGEKEKWSDVQPRRFEIEETQEVFDTKIDNSAWSKPMGRARRRQAV